MKYMLMAALISRHCLKMIGMVSYRSANWLFNVLVVQGSLVSRAKEHERWRNG